MKRDLATIIHVLHQFIPVSFVFVRERLENVQSQIPFMAPELHGQLWLTTGDILADFSAMIETTLPEQMTSVWYSVIKTIWMDKLYEED
jgi:hypothetical protein